MQRPGATDVAAVAGFSLVMAALCAPVYLELSSTYDEGAHAAAGIAALQRGDHSVAIQHPPLARLPAALLLTAAGVESRATPVPPGGGDEQLARLTGMVFGGAETYWRRLTLARLGTLAFVPLLIGFVWKWSRELWGAKGAALSCSLAAFSPTLLAHASVATVDFACAATVLAAAYGLRRCASGWKTGALVALAAAAKYSSLPFLALTLLLRRNFPSPRQALAGAALAFLALWAVFGFETGPLATPGDRPHRSVDRVFAEGSKANAFAYSLIENVPVPLVSMIRGLRMAAEHGASGHPAFLLGERSTRGWLHYFPVAILVKTTIPLLLLSAGGVVLCFRRRLWEVTLPAAAILTVVILSPLNIGLRHALPLYPFLAILGGALLASKTRFAPLVLLLAGWHGVEALRAAPDYLPYFNQSVRGREAAVLADSNLDWGQDLYRLRRFMDEQGIDRIWLNYFGTTDPAVLGIRATPFGPGDRPTGWVAASVTALQGVYEPKIAWLEGREASATVGASIRVYHIE